MTDKLYFKIDCSRMAVSMHNFTKRILPKASRVLRDWLVWPSKRYNQFINRKRRGCFAASSHLSIWLRPLWKRDWIKSIFGAPLMAALIAGSVQSLPATTSFNQWRVGQELLEVMEIPLTTNVTANAIPYNLPTSNLLGVSQFYHAGHTGVDLRAPVGTPVVALLGGTIADVRSDAWGYGRHIIVDHGDGVQSLYAHLQKSVVTIGQNVDGGTQIGTIGLTGWTTGPHLHFEVYKFGQKVNPLPYLQMSLKAYNENYQLAQSQ